MFKMPSSDSVATGIVISGVRPCVRAVLEEISRKAGTGGFEHHAGG
jgi:hypothetical protein